MKLYELSNRLQDLCHAGYAQNKIYVGEKVIKGIKRFIKETEDETERLIKSEESFSIETE